MAVEKFALSLLVLLADVLSLLFIKLDDDQRHSVDERLEKIAKASIRSNFLLAEAKGVAGLGKAGGDGGGGSDKAGQQVPPEVYNALTYAGTAFLFTLSVPLILYGLNKFLNWIEDCFGCGPSSKKEEKKKNQAIETEQLKADATKKPPLQKTLPVLTHQSLSSTSATKSNISILSQQQQQQQLQPNMNAPTDLTAITIPPNTSDSSESHYKPSPTNLEHKHQQQYIF